MDQRCALPLIRNRLPLALTQLLYTRNSADILRTGTGLDGSGDIAVYIHHCLLAGT